MNKRHALNRPRLLSLLLILPILVLLAGGRGEATGLRLIYANDNLGELDGCG
jgi:hypothetical protein